MNFFEFELNGNTHRLTKNGKDSDLILGYTKNTDQFGNSFFEQAFGFAAGDTACQDYMNHLNSEGFDTEEIMSVLNDNGEE